MISRHCEELVRAVVHWLSFEKLCGRSNLFSEAYLKHPIGQFLNSAEGVQVEAEYMLPCMQRSNRRGRKRQFDFAILQLPKLELAALLETKWIGRKRDYGREIIRDISRLEYASSGDLRFDRLLLVAGQYSEIASMTFSSQGNVDGIRDLRFADCLPSRVGDRMHIAPSECTSFGLWRDAYDTLDSPVPTSLVINLAAQFPENAETDSLACLLWRVETLVDVSCEWPTSTLKRDGDPSHSS